MQTTFTHNENDTAHWSPQRAAAAAKQQRLAELRLSERKADEWADAWCDDDDALNAIVKEIKAIRAEIVRIEFMTPLEYAAEAAALSVTEQAQADADELSEFVKAWPDQTADYAEAFPDTLAAGLDAAGYGSAGPM